MKKILLVLAHDDKSLSAALMDRYKTACATLGHQLKETKLMDMSFDPILRGGHRSEQSLEADLQKAQADILWADEIVFFFPVWWYAVPAILKGFFDRVLNPGFAFKYREGKPLPEKLLLGKTAKLVVLSGGPSLYYALLGNPATKMMKTSLKFCGISPVKVLACGGIDKNLSEAKVKGIFAKVESLAK